ncbi:MAG: IS1595 family transposase [Bacteroidetes bacterium]|nr:IS1595 family transposase [Bacteroidota bacterium]
MPRLNKYYRRSRISEARFRQLIRCSALDLTASHTAQLTGLSHRSVNAIFLKIRHRLVPACNAQAPLCGNVEVDESYFGPKRVRSKRGRGAGGKTIVFGIFKRDDCVYTEIVPNASKKVLQGIIRGHVDAESIIFRDGWRGYDGLVDVGYQKHYRVCHGSEEFARGEARRFAVDGSSSLESERVEAAPREGVQGQHRSSRQREVAGCRGALSCGSQVRPFRIATTSPC